MVDFSPPLSAPHKLAQRHSAKVLLQASASRLAAELLSTSRDGSVPEATINDYAAGFRNWVIAAIESAVLPKRMQQAHNDDDDEH